MPTSRLFIRARSAGRIAGAESPLFTTVILSRPYFPARGIPYSILIHALVLSVLILLRVSHALPAAQPPSAPKAVVIDSAESRVVMFLPLLGGGSQGKGSEGLGLPGGGLKARRKGPPAAPAPGRKGLSYPGPQPILSDFPQPTNLSQTLLQPALKNPPTLPPPLSLPNIVKMADAGPALRSELPQPFVNPPEIKPAEPPAPKPEPKPPEPPSPPATLAMPTPVDKLVLVQPANIPKIGLLPEKVFPEPIPSLKPSPPDPLPPAPKPVKAPPSPEPLPLDPTSKIIDEPKSTPQKELSPLPTRGNDPHNLLALSPTPTFRDQPFEVPIGEARGRFAISPEPNTGATEQEPGSKLASSSPAAGIGSHTGAPNGTEAAGSGSSVAGDGGGGTGSGSGGGSGSGTGSGPGSGPGPGVGSGSGSGSGSGPGSVPGGGSGLGPGVGSGSGAGTGRGTGSGAGSGPGKGPFAGISIVGGVGDSGTAGGGANPAPRAPQRRPLQTAYGITIISTENSGGGLPPYGVFAREQVYTVYLDMRQEPFDSTPSWTLEFAVPQGPPGQAGTAAGQQGLVLPFPVEKDPPVLPPELVRKYLRRMMIVYGVVNVEGKMEQISVKESPDVLLNDPVATALSKWKFRPATLNGEPVPAKVLMGIPLWLPE
jgi:hypothetical protein